MNDLERDLKELFETKADEVRAEPLAPAAVLKRGRRRQVGTVAGGALAVIAAAALVVGSASAFLADRSEAPPMGERVVLPQRTATIAGVTVTVPEGWSLLDQSALGFVMPTQECSASFTATATPVGEGQPAPERTPTAEPTATEECTPLEVPAGGIPVFTMGNAQPHPFQTMCEISPEIPTQTVTDDDAFLAVSMNVPADGNAIGTAWPASLEPEQGPCGEGLYARWSAEGTGYLAVARFGPDATDADRAAVIRAFEDLRFSTPEGAVSLVLGYLLDGGDVAGAPWRVVAGPNLLCASKDACGVGVAVVSGGGEGTDPRSPVVPPSAGTPVTAGAETVGERVVVYGTADPSVRSVEVVASDGTRTPASLVRWPDTLQGFENADVLAGSVWWALMDDVDRVEALLEDGTTYSTQPGRIGLTISAPSPSMTSAPSAEGRAFAGEDFDTQWDVRFSSTGRDPLCIMVTIGATAYEPLCPTDPASAFPENEPGMQLWVGTSMALLAGTVPDEVVGLEVGDGLDGSGARAECTPGPEALPGRQLCVMVLPPQGPATVLYRQPGGSVTEEALDWGTETATAAPAT